MEQNLIIVEEQEVMGKQFRIYGSKEEPIFLAKDVANWIEHSDTSKMVKTIDEDEKLMRTLFVSGQNRECLFLTEDGLYEVLMQSRKPIAKKFKKEVKKVLRQIRQTGGYIPIEEDMSDSEIMARALIVAQKTIDNKSRLIQQQRKQLEDQKPKVDFADSIEISSNSIGFKEFADLLHIAKFGRNTMMKWFRIQEYINSNNEPYRKYIEQGLFETKESTFETPYGKILTNITTYITGKGQLYFQKKIDEYLNDENRSNK